MSLLTRARLSTRSRLSALQIIPSLHPLKFYSTKTSDSIPKTLPLTRPKTRKSSGSPSFSQRIKAQTGASTVWPKPKGIPYQAKIANLVNLFGFVKTSVRFEAAADGKHFTTIFISPENSGKHNNSSLIPVVFDGDLAHVVAHHVKENDFVFVSGQLSVKPLGFAFGEGVGRLHVAAENLNYVVEGLEVEGNVSGNNIEVKTDNTSLEKKEQMRKLLDNPDLNLIIQHLMHQLKSFSSAKNDCGSLVSSGSSGAPTLDTDADATTSEIIEAKVEKGDENRVESGKETKGGDGSWRDLLINPRQWWDYRDHKAKGFVKEKLPDFRHKETGEGLWFDKAPKWVWSGIEKLEFDSPFIKQNPLQGGGGTGGKNNGNKKEDLWKRFVENPYKWWDNRSGKRSSKAPDFKHKETGEVLWLNNAPDWVSSKLPPLREGKNRFNGKQNQQTV